VAVVERVTLKLDVDTNTSSLAKATGQLKAFERAAKSNDRSINNMGRSMDRADRRFGKLGRTFRRVGQMATKFFAIFTKFSFIAYAGQVAVLTTALLGAKLAMATGRVAAQGYSIALKGVATAAVAAATAVSIAAASMRQFQEAQLSPFTGGVGGAAVRNRTVSPLIRGLMGSEVTQQALRGLAKSGVSVSQQNAVLSELFNISGGDSKQVTSLIGAISGDPGTFKEAVGKSAGGAAAAGRAGDLQGQQLIQLLASGGLTSGTGFSGLQNVMGATVIGTLKTEMQSLLSVFADVGEGLLGPTRDTIRLMSSTLTVFFQRSIPLIMKFGDMVLGSNGLASGLQKMSNSLFRLIDKTLPGLEGFVSRMSDMASSTRMFFRSMGNALRPLESGAEVLMSVFGEIFGGMGGNGVLDRFNRTLTENAGTFREFGESIGNVFEAFFAGSGGGDSMVSVVDRMTTAFNQFATDVVPPLKEIANTMKDIVLNGLPGVLSLLSGLVQTLAPLLGGVSSFAGRFGDVGSAALLLGLMGGKARFGRMGRTQASARRRDAANGMASDPGFLAMAMMSLSGSRIGQSMGLMPGRTFGGNLAEVGFKRFGGAIHTLDRVTQGAIVGKGNIPPHKMDKNMMRIARLGGAATLAGGMVGGMSMMNAFGDARATGDTSAFNLLQGAGGGAALGFMLGGPLGALAGGAIGGLGTMFLAGRAKKRRTNNLNRFTQESLTNVSISAEEALANFNHTLENFEEVAKQGDMSADELKERLDDLKPVFDDLSRQIETKVSSRVELLTEVFGYAADEADQLARSLNNIDFNRLAAQNFNNVARDATGAFGFNVIAADTTANRTMLQRTQGGLEAQIRSMFGGDLDLAAQSEEGMRLIEALYTNIFTQSMLEEGQEARGAEFTAGQMLETIFGPSQFTEEFIANNIDLLEENKTIAELIGEGNDSLEVIAEKLDFAFGGRAEDVLRDRLGEKFDQEFAGNVMGGAYAQARAAYIDQNIGTAMGNMLSISNPISVDLEINGLITEDVKQQIIEIVETQTARMGEDLTDVVNDTVSGNGMTVIGTRGRVRVSEGTTTSNSNGLESGETATSRRRGT
jgi:hypothetical protein